VPLHSSVDGATVRVVNHSASAKMSSELIPIHDDLGVYYHSGVIKPARWNVRVPENEQVMLIGFTDPEQTEAEMSTGFCSKEGLYDACSDVGDCGGSVVACKDGALVGFHIAGGEHVNRFIPVTERMVEAFKASLPTLSSMKFH